MKKKYQAIIGLLLSMMALFMLSCEDVMTGNQINEEQNGARYVYSAQVLSATRSGNVASITVIATGGQEGNVVTTWKYNGSNYPFTNQVVEGPFAYSGSGAMAKFRYEYKFTMPTTSGTFRWQNGAGDCSATFN